MDQSVQEVLREGYSLAWIQAHQRLGLFESLNQEELDALGNLIRGEQHDRWRARDLVKFEPFKAELEARIKLDAGVKVALYRAFDLHLAKGAMSLVAWNRRGRESHYLERVSYGGAGSLLWACRRKNGCSPPRVDMRFDVESGSPTCSDCHRVDHSDSRLYFSL